MRRIALLSLATLLVALLVAPVAARWGVAAQSDPITLDLVDNYVTVLSDGRLNVRYTLTFTELEAGRDRFRAVGPFPDNHTIVSSSGSGPDGVFTVTLSGDGRPYYQVNFERSTRKGQQYEVMIRYTVDRSVFDETTYQGQSYRAIGWAPFEWSLPITRQEIRYILPLELPDGITQAEQVTDEIVNASGLLVNDTSGYDRWVYFSTPDEQSGKNWLS
ncbi:MAG: hypothetical protein GX557_06720, partial [Chloroflexi bacterium]|nr:hypothetical protein [Chloroflexota bacterium]